MSDALRDCAARLGVSTSYKDQLGRTREASADTLRAVVAAMGMPTDPDALCAAMDAEPEVPPYVICEPGAAPDFEPAGDWRITLEDGATSDGRGAVPPLPLGRHRLEAVGGTTWLLVAPRSLAAPPRGWGITLPLYGLRGRRGGLGDYRDLLEALRGAAQNGAGFVGVNPIHAGFTADPGAISPYSPSHRRRLAVQHIHLPGEPPAEAFDLLDYSREVPARLAELRELFEMVGMDPRIDDYVDDQGSELLRFATYEALAEIHGPRWDGWPAELQDCDSPAVASFARDNAETVRFHAWLQFLADRQLGDVAEMASMLGMAQGLYLDLAVGTHPHGAETWSDPVAFAPGVSLGSPPDAFSKDGQVWGVAPFNPRALIRSGFAALAATLRAQLRHAGMLRIDHILGFERAFWVPEGLPGAYVQMPREAMLAVIRIEAERAGAVVVGEDLGNVPEGLGEALAASGILGCRVIMFEGNRPAEKYPAAVLASFGTHDLPTYLGWRAARDIAARELTAGMSNGDEQRKIRAREVAALDSLLGRNPSVDDMHAFLGSTPSHLVALQVEDVLGLPDQPNLPGTTDRYPNWRRPLPVDAVALATDPGMIRAAEIMARAGR